MYRELDRHPRNTRLALMALGAAVIAAAIACGDSKITPKDSVAGEQPPTPVAAAPVAATPQPTDVATGSDGSVAPSAVTYENVKYADAEAAFTTRDYATAQAMFTAYTEQHPKNPWGYYMLGLSAWKAGDPVQAESAFVAALDRDPRHVKSMLNLSRVFLETERASDALERVQQALAVDSMSTDAYRLMGRTQLALGHVDMAIDAYRTAIGLDTSDVWSMNNLGLILIQQGRFDEALGPLARATQLDSTVPVFQNNLGIALERTGHYTASAEAYRAALSADSTYEKASVSLARVDGRPDEPGVEPVDLATLARDFALEVEAWREAPVPAESVATIPKLDSLPKLHSLELGTGPVVKKPKR